MVDEPALITALQSGTIAAAGLDVLEQEPTDPNNPLLSMVMPDPPSSLPQALHPASEALGPFVLTVAVSCRTMQW